MSATIFRIAFQVLVGAIVVAAQSPATSRKPQAEVLVVEGEISPIHDPAMIREGANYYVFATNRFQGKLWVRTLPACGLAGVFTARAARRPPCGWRTLGTHASSVRPCRGIHGRGLLSVLLVAGARWKRAYPGGPAHSRQEYQKTPRGTI